VFQLKTERQDERHHAFDKRLAIAWESVAATGTRKAHHGRCGVPYPCTRHRRDDDGGPRGGRDHDASPGPGSLHPTRLGGNQPALRGGLCHEAKLMLFLGDGTAAHHVTYRRLDNHRGGLALLDVGVEDLHPGHLLPPCPIPLELEASITFATEMCLFKLW